MGLFIASWPDRRSSLISVSVISSKIRKKRKILITDLLITSLAIDDEYEHDLVATRRKEETFWGEAVVYSSTTGFDSALIIKTSETAAVTTQKASQR